MWPSFLRIWSHLLEKSLMENFIFCAVKAIGICAGDFWIRADLLHQVRWSEGYPIWKSARSNLYLEVKACILTPQINQTFKTNLCITYCRLFLSKLGRYSIKLLLQMFDKTQKWWWLCWKTCVSEKHILRLNKKGSRILLPDNNSCIAIRQKGVTAQKMKFSIKDFSSKCDKIRRKLRIWSHLLKKS